jgi:hypothetical protein
MSIIFIDYEDDNLGEKMSSCKYRSKDKVKESTGCCGGSRAKEAFKCLKRGIFPLKNHICEDCNIYQK